MKYNGELYSLYTETNMVKMIKIGRLKWLGRIAKMEDNVPCMKITFSQPEDSRKQGRSILRRLDSVLKNLKNLEVDTWRKKARDRGVWNEVISEAAAHEGCGTKEDDEDEEV
jgi:hypothetical protein